MDCFPIDYTLVQSLLAISYTSVIGRLLSLICHRHFLLDGVLKIEYEYCRWASCYDYVATLADKLNNGHSMGSVVHSFKLVIPGKECFCRLQAGPALEFVGP